MKDLEILSALPRDTPIPGRIATKVHRIKAKPIADRSPEEAELLKLYLQRSVHKSSKLVLEQQESSGPSAEMAVASVYTTAIAEHKDLAQTLIKSLVSVNKDGLAALVDVSKAQQRALDNAAEREELCMDRLRKEQKRADKYESKYRKLRDEVDDLTKEVEELKNAKEDESTLDKAMGIFGKMIELKRLNSPAGES